MAPRPFRVTEAPLKCASGPSGSAPQAAIGVGTGTWKVVRGTGRYADITGGGRQGNMWLKHARGPWTGRAEGFLRSPQQTRRKMVRSAGPAAAVGSLSQCARCVSWIRADARRPVLVRCERARLECETPP